MNKLMLTILIHVLASLLMGLKAQAANRCSRTHNDFVKLAVIQYPIQENLTKAQFFEKSETLVRQAHAKGSDLVVFPELHSLDMINTRSPESWASQLSTIARDVTPEYFQRMSELAKELGISILAGTMPRHSGDKTVNTAMLALPDGKTHHQDKLYMTPDEIGWGWSGTDSIKVIETPWGRVSILICFDCEFPIISNSLAKYKPEIILVPSMTGDRSGLHRVQWSAQARAIEHYAYVIHTGTTQASAEPYFGQASIITPQEPGFPTRVKRGRPNREQILYGEIDIKHLRDRRDSAGIYPAREQNRIIKALQVEEIP